jgi:saposin
VCISITEEYYDAIYKYLTNVLAANKSCAIIGVCDQQKQPTQNVRILNVPAMPLLLSNDLFPAPQEGSIQVNQVTVDSSIKLIDNGKKCTICEYVVEFIHVEMGNHNVQDKVLAEATKGCKKLPLYVKQCEDLIDAFGTAIISAIYEGANARLVCPDFHFCPPNFSISYMEQNAVDEKPTCQFCILAIQEIIEVVEKNQTKASIQSAVSKLCDKLPTKLKSQCVEFVNTYSNEVVDMILANFTPQEACVFIKLCDDNQPKRNYVNIVAISKDSDESKDFFDEDDETNDDSQILKMYSNPQCDLCKTVVGLIEQRVIDIKSKDEIRRELENSCNRLRKFTKECKAFVDKYSDQIVDLISKELSPEQVCKDLIFCVAENQRINQDYDFGLEIMASAMKGESIESSGEESSVEVQGTAECVVCEFIVDKLKNELNDKQTDAEVKHVIKNVCSKMPQTVSRTCNKFIDYYFDMIIALLEVSKTEELCAELKACPKVLEAEMELKIKEIKNDLYSCAVCRGVVESLDTIIEDPTFDTNLENLEEKVCKKFAGKFNLKVNIDFHHLNNLNNSFLFLQCHNLASTFGVAIINLLKEMTESDQICLKLDLCPMSNGMLRLS